MKAISSAITVFARSKTLYCNGKSKVVGNIYDKLTVTFPPELNSINHCNLVANINSLRSSDAIYHR